MSKVSRPVLIRSSIACVCLLALASLGLKVADSPATQMRTFAVAFLDTLEPGQVDKTMFAFDAKERVGWHFIPMESRKGLMLSEMNEAQRTAALRLLRSALSEAGYGKANRIMLLEEVLNEMEAGKGRWERNPLRYYVTIFGDPRAESNAAELKNAEPNSAESRWGLSFEGHHLSLNFVCRGGKLVDSTPQFLAANPATIMNETSVTLGKGTRVLNNEEQLGFKLVQSLDANQKGLALIADEAPAEIRFAGEPQVKLAPAEGIEYSKLDADQQAILKDLIFTYTNVAPEKVAAERRGQIDQDGWDSVRFAWAGATRPGVGHYYRVQGKRFMIEFVNTQSDPAGNPANHIHCVYRDLTGDFDLPL